MKMKVIFNKPMTSRISLASLVMSLALLGPIACSSDDAGASTSTTARPLAQDVASDYATIAHASYGDALRTAEALRTAVDAFTEAPSAEKLEAAKKAWLTARDAYGRTEVFRFFKGPADGDDGPEARLNAWPIDEQYVDGTKDTPTSGIINLEAQFPTLDEATLAKENEKGGEKNISCGYHAIEFLLWGQDESETGPGNRPFTDFVDGAAATRPNGARRRAYLKAATSLLVTDLRGVVDAWDPSKAGSYGATFASADEVTIVGRMVQGMAALAGIELARERIGNAYETQDEEEEHSCFSDNTTGDLVANVRGIEEVYLGKHGSVVGKGVTALVAAKDPALDAKAKKALAEAVAAVEAIPAPFDRAIHDDAVGRVKLKAAIDANKALTDVLLEIANLHGARIFLD